MLLRARSTLTAIPVPLKYAPPALPTPPRPADAATRPATGSGGALGWYLVGVAALAAAYYLTAQVGLAFALVDRNVTLVWPPTGIAVAVLFRAGLRFWPGALAGAFATNVSFSPVWVAAGIAVGNTAGPVVAVLILRRLRFARAFSGRGDLFAFLFAGAAGMAITATNGVFWLVTDTPELADRLAAVWLVWWLGDTAGMLIVSPVLLAADRPRRARPAGRTALPLLATAALSWLAFSNLLPAEYLSALVFPPFMLLIWVGLRQRLQVGTLHLFVLSAVAVAGTAGGQGAFGQGLPVTQVLMLWALVTTAALVVLALTTARTHQERAEAALAAAAAEYQSLVDCTPAAIVRYTADGTLTFVNETLCRLLGRPRAALVGASVLDYIPAMPRVEGVADLPLAPDTSGPAAGASGVIRKPDGSCRWYRWTARLITTADGRAEFQAVGIDLTERRQAEAERAAIERKMQDAQRLEALGVLAGGVAHDFNNLLAGVLGHAELAVTALPAAWDHNLWQSARTEAA